MKELKIMEDNIQAPWNIHIPLQENIDKMSKANLDLANLYPSKLLSQNAMFSILFNEASKDAYDLKSILNEWTTNPDNEIETSKFTDLANFFL